jgi:uncharacterized membrane protein
VIEPQVYLLVLCVGSAVLAMWSHARYPRVAPNDLRVTLVHVLASFGLAWLAAGALRIAVGKGVPPGPALLAVILPALFYVFLANLWLMRVLQSFLSGARR